MSKILCYTDGGCHKNPGQLGSWSYSIYIYKAKPCKKFNLGMNLIQQGAGYITGASITNNIAELTGLLKCLMAIKTVNSIKPNSEIEIYTDSMYAVKGFNNEIQLHSNLDIWENIKNESKTMKNVNCHWIKGHADSVENNFVDKVLVMVTSKLKGF